MPNVILQVVTFVTFENVVYAVNLLARLYEINEP